MSLLISLIDEFPSIKFEASNRFQWSPETNSIYYDKQVAFSDWSLLHELGHMISGHNSYSSDLGLLKMEVEAWEKARTLANKYRIKIDDEHIEKCLDSYRDWLYKRSSCPTCTQAGIEKNTGKYQCINCMSEWQVTPERFCRVYRKAV